MNAKIRITKDAKIANPMSFSRGGKGAEDEDEDGDDGSERTRFKAWSAI